MFITTSPWYALCCAPSLICNLHVRWWMTKMTFALKTKSALSSSYVSCMLWKDFNAWWKPLHLGLSSSTHMKVANDCHLAFWDCNSLFCKQPTILHFTSYGKILQINIIHHQITFPYFVPFGQVSHYPVMVSIIWGPTRDGSRAGFSGYPTRPKP